MGELIQIGGNVTLVANWCDEAYLNTRMVAAHSSESAAQISIITANHRLLAPSKPCVRDQVRSQIDIGLFFRELHHPYLGNGAVLKCI